MEGSPGACLTQSVAEKHTKASVFLAKTMVLDASFRAGAEEAPRLSGRASFKRGLLHARRNRTCPGPEHTHTESTVSNLQCFATSGLIFAFQLRRKTLCTINLFGVICGSWEMTHSLECTPGSLNLIQCPLSQREVDFTFCNQSHSHSLIA